MKKFICFFTALTLIMALPMVASATEIPTEISWVVDSNWIDREYVLAYNGTNVDGTAYFTGFVKLSDVYMTPSEFGTISSFVMQAYDPNTFEVFDELAATDSLEFKYGDELEGNNLYFLFINDELVVIFCKGTVDASKVGMTGTFTEGIWAFLGVESDMLLTANSIKYLKYEYQMGDVGADLGIVKEDLANIKSEIKNGFINLFVPDTNGQGASDKFLSQVDSNKQEASDIKDQLDSVNKPDADDLHDQVNPDQFIDKEDESVIEMNAVIASVFDLKILGKYIMVLLGLGFVSLIFFGKKEG